VVSAPFESQSVAQAGEVAVIGAGYVGLTSAVCLAHLGHRVVCADVDAYKVAELAAGRPTHHEPGIDGLLRAGLDAGNLRFVLGAAEAVADADVVLLCLPTPMGADGRPDLTALTGVATAIGPQLLPGAVVVDKSTVPVGTTRVVADCLGRGDVAVVANPEFLREGQAVHDFLHPDRVVIGGEDRDATARVAALYESLGCPVLVTDAVSAEITKYAANAFLVTKLSFANSVAAVCEALGGDAHDVLRGVGYDHRVGHAHLRPGPGWGGSCFPKDVQALLHLAHDAGEPFHLLQAVLDANESHFDRVAERVLTLAGDVKGEPVVAAWGLTFKADTDDLRESPALAVLRRVVAGGGRVRVYDPVTTPERLAAFDPDLAVGVVADAYEACTGADVLVVLTEWQEFASVDLARVASLLRRPHVYDTRGVLDRSELARLGLVARIPESS